MYFSKFYYYKASDDKELYKKINSGIFEVPNYVPSGAGRLIKSILKIKPTDRPSTSEVRKKFFLI